MDVSRFEEAAQGTVVHSIFGGIPSAKRARLSDRTRDGYAGDTYNRPLRAKRSAVTSLVVHPPVKYPLQEKALKDFMTKRWHSGDPAAKHECYDELRLKNLPGSDFYEQFLSGAEDKKGRLQTWFKHASARAGYTALANTVCQKIPDDWHQNFEFQLRGHLWPKHTLNSP